MNTKNGINVLSLFDGISCGQLALEKSGVRVVQYFASENDKHVVKVTNHNYPNTIQLGDVENWKEWNLPKIDLLIGGSPCQGFSVNGKGLNFNDPRSKLFFVYVDILKHLKKENPDLQFLLENVKMKKDWQDIISSYLGVEPVLINSALVTAQNRQRLYWTNICEITQPEDKNIILQDVLEEDANPKYIIKGKRLENFIKNFEYRTKKQWVALDPEKAICMTSRQFANWYGNHVTVRGAAIRNQVTNRGVEEQLNIRKDLKSNCVVESYSNKLNGLYDGNQYRQLTPVECERLQTIPDNYTSIISDSQRYKALGNGWTVDVIAHIFNGLTR